MLDIVLEVFRQLTRSSSLKRLLFQLVSTEGDYNFMNINHWKLNVKPERLCFWIPIWFEENTMVVPVYEYKRWENHVAGSRTLLRRASATRILVSNLPIDRNICTPYQRPENSFCFLPEMQDSTKCINHLCLCRYSRVKSTVCCIRATSTCSGRWI